MIGHPPGSTRSYPLFPYTALFRSMGEGRPDWVLSRQRAGGVPITLFVHRKTGQYLIDPAVNDRIVAAVQAAGVDAWSDARAQEYLGDAYDAADYERITDILDVWFDSGCTHAFVRSEEHTSELQSLMRISYAVFCLKKNNT